MMLTILVVIIAAVAFDWYRGWPWLTKIQIWLDSHR